MRVLIAFDKFKDAISAKRACEVAARSLRQIQRDWTIDMCPLADGGDGFEEVLRQSVTAQGTALRVTGPRGGLIEAGLTLISPAKIPPDVHALLAETGGTTLGSKPLAIVEMASASGLALLPPDARDPWRATSHGTGQLLRGAAELGAGAIVLGLGGSATHDLGLGALNALGYEFRSRSGQKLRPPLPASWSELHRIEGELFPSIPPIFLAADVTNPLLGPNGAAAVYAPQKGLPAAQIAQLDELTARMARLLCTACAQPFDLTESPGVGAAGGTAFGLVCAARARLISGTGFVSRWLRLAERIRQADIVITGEGRFDASSLQGKAPGEIILQSTATNKRVLIFAGQATVAAPPGCELRALTPDDVPLNEALGQTSDRLAQAIARALA